MRKIRNLSFLLKRAWEIKKSVFLVFGLYLILQAIQPYITIWFSAQILDGVSQGLAFSVLLNDILWMVGVNLFIAIAMDILLYFRTGLSQKLNNYAACDILMDNMSIDYHYSESGQMLDVMQSFFIWVQPVEYMQFIVGFVAALIQVCLSIYIVVNIHPLILLALSLFVAIKSLLVRNGHQKDYQWSVDQTRDIRKLNYLKNIMTLAPFAKEVRINGGRNWLIQKFENALASYSVSFRKYCQGKARYKTGIAIIDMLQQVFIYLYFPYRVIAGTLSLGSLSMMLQLTSLFYASVNKIFENYSFLSKVVGEHVEAYKEYIKKVETGNSAYGTLSTKMSPEHIELEFKNVSMTYPQSEKTVLQNVSFHIRSGEHMAIVGQNGAGKSTIVKLICRLYEPTEGEILLNGININEYQYEEYMKLLSTVLQDFKLLAFSIKDNVILNYPYDEEKFAKAIEISDFKSKLQSLSNGENTTLYRQYYEDGVELSGGEAQRLALAREIYKNGKLFILDEPTSALDALSEHRIFESMHLITQDKTSIFISHRMSSIIFCDHIVVLQNGSVLEEGDHKTLMEKKGLYYEMFSRQAEHYMEGDNHGN